MPSYNHEPVPSPAVRRLSLYLRRMEQLQGEGVATVSSRQLADSLGLTDAQVRKDLAYFGQFGQPGVGYRVDDMIARLRHILGTDRIWTVLLMGAGNLGRALAAYRGFEHKGFRLAAVFDTDPNKVGKRLGGLEIRPLETLDQVVRQEQIRLAILAVPADAAQAAADRLVAAGVRGILNFAPVSLVVPEGVGLAGVDLAVHLEQLSFAVNSADAATRTATAGPRPPA